MTCRRERQATAAMALEFLILTVARSGEVLGARWAEFDLESKVWTIPAARMKAGREHRVPLSSRALAILEAVAKGRTGVFVFPGQRPGKPLSGMAMEMVLRRMNVDVTVHGFRSSFRDWRGEATSFPRELAEAALRLGRCHGAGLPAWRCSRKAARANGRMGKFLRAERKRECHYDSAARLKPREQFER
jgi:integrase